MSTVNMAPDGALLSCYTSSIAEAMWRQGVDWEAVIGLGSIVAIRPDGDLFAFRHHSTSLRAWLAPGLHRTGADDDHELFTGLTAAYERDGCVIVTGDVHNLPWSTGFRCRHAPHWCVVDGRRDGRWHVTDRFSMLDAQGEQSPFQGWIPEGNLPALLETGELRPEERLRERFAFGDEEPALPRSRYLWFSSVPSATGEPARAESGEWLSGAQAIHRLIDHFAQAGTDPEAFRQVEDLWVASRHRSLRQLAVERILPCDTPQVTASRALADSWERVPMMLRYAAESFHRGRPKLSALRTALEAVAEQESRVEELNATSTGSAEQ